VRMTRIFYALVIVGSAGLFHYINGYFTDIKKMRSDNVMLTTSVSTLSGHLKTSNAYVERLIKENKRLAQIDSEHRANMTALSEALATDRKEHQDEIEALESEIINAGVCHVRVPDAIRRMHTDRADQINSRTHNSDNATCSKTEARTD